MSCTAPKCPHCQGSTHFVETSHYGPPESFTSVWRCDACAGEIWEMAGLAKTVPKPGHCLACAARVGADGHCRNCKLARPPVVAKIHERCGAPPDPQAIRDLCEEGLFRLALCAANLRLSTDADDPRGLWAKGKIYADLERYAEAVPLLRRATELDDDPGLLIDLGVSLANSGKVDEAEAVYHRYLDACPTGDGAAVVLTNLGGLASGRGRVRDGEALHRRAMAMDPDNAMVRLNLLANLLRQRRYPDALTVIDDSMAAAPPEVADEFRQNALCYRAEVLLLLDRPGEALRDIDESLARDPDNLHRMMLRARVLMDMDQPGEAEAQLLAMLEHSPGHPAIQRMLDNLGKGRILH
ncbi:MAG: tetratricopeptide repeat protein [Myxococcales bacterium]|nr:tetratricopeptide repeat protein [Myxococcales bacterium]